MARRWLASSAAGLIVLLLAGSQVVATGPLRQTPGAAQAVVSTDRLVSQYCLGCHNSRTKTGGLALDAVDTANVGKNLEVWEKVLRKLRARAMPPPGAPRPNDSVYESWAAGLTAVLDQTAAAQPNPGRVATFRRLNRAEYQNAIRDLLDLDVDVTSLLPQDDASYGFDNISVLDLSATLLERYLSAAQKVSRLAIGSPVPAPASYTIALPPDLTQEDHIEGLPLGTRGGTLVQHTFPLDGEYEIRILLARDREEVVEGLTETHQMELTLDGERLEVFPIVPNVNRDRYRDDKDLDKHLHIRLPIKAGPHALGVTFPRKTSALIETERQPYEAHFNLDRHPRIQPAVFSVSITGPFDAAGAQDTPSRRRIFSCHPENSSAQADCAKTIISTLARRAFRRPVSDSDIRTPLDFYNEARRAEGFDAGIEMALRALLASTEFLFRIERDPRNAKPNAVYSISDVELASRLSFFLWSSIPDNELLDAAAKGKLHEPDVLEHQVRRMLADSRSKALVTNFAGQWLQLRNLVAANPNLRLFPDFDDNLRQAFRTETEMFFESIAKEDRNVLDLLTANYTFVNERLAKHYGIPNVYGSRFRRITFPEDSVRRGLLGQGSILTVTSYATRTSPVFRGKWILENILGTPPPPPPPNVPPLPETNKTAEVRSMRQRMAQHRTNPACAACHQLMDPIGLSMENFDAIGRWRDRGEDGRSAVDATGSLPDGSTFEGTAGLRRALLNRPEQFITTVTEKLLTYALGRGLEYYDAAAVRAIVREAGRSDYRFSSIILGIGNSSPFQMRTSQ